ncbi:hypothetical protein BsWGS_08461 [Bradybaena similaris]
MVSRKDQGMGSIYVGQLHLTTQIKDLEQMFEGYGPILGCDIKYAYAFIDFEVKEDAADCVRFENGRNVKGMNMIVEWCKETREERLARRYDPANQAKDMCFKCHRIGHWVQDCPELNQGKRHQQQQPSQRPSKKSKHEEKGTE